MEMLKRKVGPPLHHIHIFWMCSLVITFFPVQVQSAQTEAKSTINCKVEHLKRLYLPDNRTIFVTASIPYGLTKHEIFQVMRVICDRYKDEVDNVDILLIEQEEISTDRWDIAKYFYKTASDFSAENIKIRFWYEGYCPPAAERFGLTRARRLRVAGQTILSAVQANQLYDAPSPVKFIIGVDPSIKDIPVEWVQLFMKDIRKDPELRNLSFEELGEISVEFWEDFKKRTVGMEIDALHKTAYLFILLEKVGKFENLKNEKKPSFPPK